MPTCVDGSPGPPEAPHGCLSIKMIKLRVVNSQRVKGFPLSEGSSEVSGNWGLLDQVATLTWVQTHIAVFGGDPRRVALAADRGGADVASIHLLTTRAADSRLFRRAVLMVSGLFCLQPCCRHWPGEAVLCLLRRVGSNHLLLAYPLFSVCSPHGPILPHTCDSEVLRAPDCCPHIPKVLKTLFGQVFLVPGNASLGFNCPNS